MPSSSPHKLDPVLEEEKKGEEEKEEDEEEEEEDDTEEEEVKGEKNKGNGWKGKEDEGEIRTFCEITKPGEIEGKPLNENENAKVEKKNKVNPPESSELQKKSRLCTGAAGTEVEVHR